MARNIVLALLAVAATLSFVLAGRTLVASPGERVGDIGEVETAILSPRRLPDALSATIADQRTRQSVQQVLTNSGLDLDQISLSIQREGRDVLQIRDRSKVIPASNLKLVTGAAAIEVLGADTKFTTRVVRTGDVQNGVLDGPLYVIGGGDPLLMTEAYGAAAEEGLDEHKTSVEALADSVKAAGITRVSGAVVGDDTIFDSLRGIPSWPTSYFQQGQSGGISGLTIDQGYAQYEGGRVGSTDPTPLAAQRFADALRSRGIAVDGGAISGKTPEGATDVARIDSAPVRDLVDEMLTFSDNVTAEVLLKNLGVKHSGQGSTDAGLVAVRDYLAANGLDTESYVGVDGSGLARGNQASCTLIDQMLHHDPVGEILRDGLPRAGETGTLKDRMQNTAAVSRVQAKTGTLNDVSSLSGWAEPAGSPPFSFCLLANGVPTETGRVAEDALAVVLAESAVPPDPATLGPVAP